MKWQEWLWCSWSFSNMWITSKTWTQPQMQAQWGLFYDEPRAACERRHGGTVLARSCGGAGRRNHYVQTLCNRLYRETFELSGLHDESWTLRWGREAACCAGESFMSICTRGSTRVPLCKLFPDLAWHRGRNMTLLCPTHHVRTNTATLGCFLVSRLVPCSQ